VFLAYFGSEYRHILLIVDVSGGELCRKRCFFFGGGRNGAILHVIIFVADLKYKNVCGDYREVMAGLLKEIIIFATVKFFMHGHLGQKETLRRHGENQGQGHEAGMDCAALPLFARLPLPQEREGVAGHTGYCVAQVWHRDFHPRVLLARA